MKPLILYTTAIVLLLAVVLAVITAMKPNDEGLKAKAKTRATAIEEATNMLTAKEHPTAEAP